MTELFGQKPEMVLDLQKKSKMAGSYMDPFDIISSPEYQKLPEQDKGRVFDFYRDASRNVDPTGERLIDWAIQQNTPEARQKIIDQQLALDKARGEQQMKYRMTNDIISNLGKAAYAAFGGGGLPYEYVGQSVANVGNAYLAGRMSGTPAAPVVGQRYF